MAPSLALPMTAMTRMFSTTHISLKLTRQSGCKVKERAEDPVAGVSHTKQKQFIHASKDRPHHPWDRQDSFPGNVGN
eukprot:scaffold225587_cov41-Attheya_sp.AAC.3